MDSNLFVAFRMDGWEVEVDKCTCCLDGRIVGGEENLDLWKCGLVSWLLVRLYWIWHVFSFVG